MPAILLSPWFWLALALAACGAATKGWIDEKAAFDSYKGAATALGQEAQARSVAQAKADKTRKELVDEKHSQAVNALADDNERLRKLAARGNTVPAAPADSAKPDLACFDRALLGAAVDDFVADVSSQAQSGAAATVDLDNAKIWAQGGESP